MPPCVAGDEVMDESGILQMYREHTSRGHYGGISYNSWKLAYLALVNTDLSKDSVVKAYDRCMSIHRGGKNGWYIVARVLKGKKNDLESVSQDCGDTTGSRRDHQEGAKDAVHSHPGPQG